MVSLPSDSAQWQSTAIFSLSLTWHMEFKPWLDYNAFLVTVFSKQLSTGWVMCSFIYTVVLMQITSIFRTVISSQVFSWRDSVFISKISFCNILSVSLITPNTNAWHLGITTLGVGRTFFSSLQNSEFGKRTRKVEGVQTWRIESLGCGGWEEMVDSKPSWIEQEERLGQPSFSSH